MCLKFGFLAHPQNLNTAVLRSIMSSNCFVIDNGAGRIKYGPAVSAATSSSSSSSGPAGSIPNCVARMNKQMQVLVGDQVDEVANGSLLSYTRPFERGYMTNMHCQTEVWSRLFTKILKVTSPVSTPYVMYLKEDIPLRGWGILGHLVIHYEAMTSLALSFNSFSA